VLLLCCCCCAAAAVLPSTLAARPPRPWPHSLWQQVAPASPRAPRKQMTHPTSRWPGRASRGKGRHGRAAAAPQACVGGQCGTHNTWTPRAQSALPACPSPRQAIACRDSVDSARHTHYTRRAACGSHRRGRAGTPTTAPRTAPSLGEGDANTARHCAVATCPSLRSEPHRPAYAEPATLLARARAYLAATLVLLLPQRTHTHTRYNRGSDGAARGGAVPLHVRTGATLPRAIRQV